MPQPERPSVETVDFLGLMANLDPRDYPPGGADILLNATAVVQGELRCRLGIQELTFED